MSFTDRWQRLAAAARQAPEVPLPTLDVARILAARRPRERVVRIGWFPPGLAATAVLAGMIALAAGLDPRPAARDAGMFLADLPRQVPRSPALSAPALPSAAALMDGLVHHSSALFPGFTEPAP